MRVIETYVGIDVSKDTLDVATHPRQQARKFKNNDSGINEAITCLQKLTLVLVVMEATGGLEMSLAAAVSAAGIPVAVINPRQVKYFARSTGRWRKRIL